MGVPRLFKWICERYPNAISHFDCTKINKPYIVDNLFIDANAILHECAQRVHNYGSHKRLMDPNKNLSMKQKNTKLFGYFFEKIQELATIAQPRKLLYIAIDGCAPAGKMMQQRQRRFMAATSSNVFDSNCISPGTEFMEELEQFMVFNLLKISFHIKVIFSSANVPGEGEHKIMEYTRTHFDTMKNEKHCMYGPDGDLIMLTLASQCEHFYLLRDDQYAINKMYMVDINNIRNGIAKEMDYKLSESKMTLIHDFVLMGFFVGNDFLPKIQMFYFLEDGMDLMLKVYWDITKGKTRMTYKNGEICLDVFLKFINELQRREKYYLEGQIKNNSVGDPRFENQTLMKCVNSSSLDYERYRIEYYNKIKNTSNVLNIKQLVQDYIQGIEWVYKYYTQGCPSYIWYYPHYYAPLMIEFKNYQKKSITYPKRDKIPHRQFQQLLMILPPRSKNLLPPYLSKLFENEDIYPKSFPIDYEGKYQEYQGIAILPLIDYAKMKTIYDKHVQPHRRNKKTHAYVFTHTDKDSMVAYKTKYGYVKTKTICRKIVT